MSIDFAIRKATALDADAVWHLRIAAIRNQCLPCYPADLIDIWTAGNFTDRFRSLIEDSWYVALDRTNQVVASGTIDLTNCRIDGVFVDPRVMRQGIGRLMLGYLENLARAAGITEVSLDATLNAAAFYRKCGFVGDQSSRYESPHGITLDCIPMAKSLAGSTSSFAD